MIDLTGKNVAYYGYTGIIDSNGVTRLCQAFNIASNKKADYIYLCLNSLGGSVADGIYFYNHIRALPTKVIMHATGLVASIATVVFVGAEIRYASANSMFMVHSTTVGPYQSVNAEQLKTNLVYASGEDERTERILKERANLSEEILLAKRTREVYLPPQEALKFGLIHEIGDFILGVGNQVVQI
ncbi:ATP-dependent Clp protease proteolytic subunit [Candidatus Binatus sp.]|uniref:ATP-dependent Clp protease proteolytic subunit n=1 Tax=Candidatus Binatus sp. TaxID=2811406 RepID=UPI002F929B2D